MSEFNESVRDIEGLTSFELGKVPEWLADRLREFVGHKEGCTDAELISFHIDREWLGDWGAATINGEEVFMFEYHSTDAWALFEPAELAEMLYCGLNVVEHSHCSEGVAAFFSEERVLIRRRKPEAA